jgi:hypothetical protein
MAGDRVRNHALMPGSSRIAMVATWHVVRSRWQIVALILAACLGTIEVALLFKAIARTDLTSDNLHSVVEVNDILHGNVLLHNWTLARDNYYLSDTPFFLLTRLLFGQTDFAIYAAPLPIYVLLLATACGIVLLNARDRCAQVIGLAALLLYLGTPGPTGFPPGSMFVGSSHGATLTFSLLSWLALDRIEQLGTFRGKRGYLLLYVTTTFFALFSDPFVIVVFLGPTLLTLCFAALTSKQSMFHLSLAGVTLGLYYAARSGLRAVRLAGGFVTIPVPTTLFLSAGDLGRNVKGVFFGLLSASDAYGFFDHQLTETATIIALFRAAGLALMLAIMARRLWHGIKEPQGWSLPFALALAMIIDIGACLASHHFTTELDSPVLTGGTTIRYLVPVTLFGGVLTALELPEIMRAIAPQPLRWACAALGGAGVVVATGLFVVTGLRQWREQPAIAHNPGKIAGAWLSEHGLTHGVGEYWAGLLIMALSREQVVVGAVEVAVVGGDRLFPYHWFSKDDWYHDRPQFVIYRTVNPYGITKTTITNTYGPPVAIEDIAGYNVALLAPAK